MLRKNQAALAACVAAVSVPATCSCSKQVPGVFPLQHHIIVYSHVCTALPAPSHAAAPGHCAWHVACHVCGACRPRLCMYICVLVTQAWGQWPAPPTQQATPTYARCLARQHASYSQALHQQPAALSGTTKLTNPAALHASMRRKRCDDRVA